ncbi:MAG: hypothetical protein HOM01_06835, partial [Kordiimonadaceae bacterium]|nr:hypothetical protein [Kordiimonadaceae bacterium]
MKYIYLVIATLFSLLLVSCNNTGGGFPQVADPPPFDYADGEDLRSRMHQLAFALQRLDNSLVTDYDERKPIQDNVVDNLQDIERI